MPLWGFITLSRKLALHTLTPAPALHSRHLPARPLPAPPTPAPPTCTMLGCCSTDEIAASMRAIRSRFSAPLMRAGRIMALTATWLPRHRPAGAGRGARAAAGRRGSKAGRQTYGRPRAAACGAGASPPPPGPCRRPALAGRAPTAVDLAKGALPEELHQGQLIDLGGSAAVGLRARGRGGAAGGGGAVVVAGRARARAMRRRGAGALTARLGGCRGCCAGSTFGPAKIREGPAQPPKALLVSPKFHFFAL
jgi:hypothetical protein